MRLSSEQLLALCQRAISALEQRAQTGRPSTRALKDNVARLFQVAELAQTPALTKVQIVDQPHKLGMAMLTLSEAEVETIRFALYDSD
jgi:hypothetical protein